MTVLEELERLSEGPTSLWGRMPGGAPVVTVAWSATAELIASLPELGVIVCRAHPFFASPTGFDPAQVWMAEHWPMRTADDRVIAAKRQELNRRGTAVLWAPELWNVDGAATRSRTLAEAAGLIVEHEVGDAVVAAVPASSFGAAVDVLAPRWSARRALLTGSADQPVDRIGLVAGVASPATLERLFAEPGVDAAIVGETVEWEGAPFLQDRRTAGHAVSLAAIGNAVSEQPATMRLADRLAGIIDAPVTAAITTDPTWTPEEIRS